MDKLKSELNRDLEYLEEQLERQGGMTTVQVSRVELEFGNYNNIALNSAQVASIVVPLTS